MPFCADSQCRTPSTRRARRRWFPPDRCRCTMCGSPTARARTLRRRCAPPSRCATSPDEARRGGAANRRLRYAAGPRRDSKLEPQPRFDDDPLALAWHARSFRRYAVDLAHAGGAAPAPRTRCVRASLQAVAAGWQAGVPCRRRRRWSARRLAANANDGTWWRGPGPTCTRRERRNTTAAARSPW